MAKLSAARLSPEQLARLVNLAEPGTITGPQVRYQVQKAREQGYPLGRGNRIRLIAYIAWLRRLLAENKLLHVNDQRSQAEVMRDRRATGRDIGPLPPVKDSKRRERCARSLRRFLKTYLPRRFTKPFSLAHLQAIRKVERCILKGGKYSLGMFRGFGKTQILIGACIWAALYGHRRYLVFIPATLAHAAQAMDAIKRELGSNELLYADFPEVCHPVRALEGIAHRCAGQTMDGRPTQIEWKSDLLRLPVAEGSLCAGTIIQSRALGSSIRGLNFTLPDGSVIRPDLALLDDPQTRESAKSPAQCDSLEALILGDVLYLADPDVEMAAIMPCTVIYKGDLAHRFLDQERHPEWQGDLIPMVRRFPAHHDDLWMKEYGDLRRQRFTRAEGGRERAEREATEFYLAHRAEMDAGAVLTWSERYPKSAHSAIQHVYDCIVDDGLAAFMAEMQLDPLDEFEGIDLPLDPRDILAKMGALPKFTAEHGTSVIVAFIDCGQQSHVHWTTCWFADGFTGGVLDYGARPVIRGKFGVEAALTSTLSEVTAHICGRSYPVAGGGESRVSLCLVDSGWLARTVYAFCRNSPHAAVLAPSKGQGGELELRAPKACARRDQGDGWYHALTVLRDARLLMYNTDHFKSFTEERLRTPMGGKGCMSLFRPDRAEEHRKFAEHVTAERAKLKETKRGDVIRKYECLPGRENHLGDCLVGCHVAAARLGITLDGMAAAKPRRGTAAGGAGGGRKTLKELLGR